ncbi:aspartate aminotransferase family protein [Anaerococcus sp. Marseille-Q5996]|uniref:aspartate aminotransferase family protein n=1 Tax=Anaerococcus sp. Marseille-Q5996 TaxID=2972769 RepID=UPI0021C7F47D|nr:aspartate aminotransferase family protein [Anaerococcus sp. Marseille-Q5996]
MENLRNNEKSVEMVKKSDQVYASAGQIRYFDICLDSAKGAILKDMDGNEYIDLLATASAMNVGHSHPKVLAAMKEQMERLLHYTPAYFYNPKVEELARKLIESTPGDFEKRVIFGNSGSDSNDAMMKFSRAYTGKQTIVSFTGSYHGSTYGSMTLSAVSLNMRRKMTPLVSGVEYMPFPNTYDRRENESETEFVDRYWQYFEDALNTYLPADEIAGVIIEPIQGDGGFLKAPQEYMDRLYKFTRENNIVFAVDEVNQGLGRSGKMWSIEHFNIEPDILTTAKSLASGMPLSAIVGRKEIMDSLEAPAHVFTTAGNPVCCAAALASFDVIEEENLIEKSRKDGEYVRERFEKMQEKYPIIGDVRIYGLNGGIELVKDQKTKEADSESASKLITYLKDNGVLMITVKGNVLRFQPPLVITRDQIDKALDTIENGLSELEKGNLKLDDDKKIGW